MIEMGLNAAHTGYEFQDLFSAYFVLDEVIQGTKSTILIDVKETSDDKFDDLTIIRNTGKYKKQFKYSNESTNHSLEKDDFSSNIRDLALYELFQSWQQMNDLIELRVCLAWGRPIDNLLDVLKSVDELRSIREHSSCLYQIDLNKLWPENGEVHSSWRKLRLESQNFNRAEFLKFCEQLIIEVELPKFSMNIDSPGQLENHVIKQLSFLGVGDYPNDHISIEEVALKLVSMIKRYRSKGGEIDTLGVLNYLGIKTDYGAIEQIFPVVEKYNVIRKEAIEVVLDQICWKKKVLLTAEPGAGKSWFVNNLESIARDKEFKVVRHYCYTDLQDQRAKDRIKLNTFYGNLIKELLEEIPSLSILKQKMYSSTFTELNRVLSGIEEKTIVIIDGLDHISRIHETNGADLSTSEIDIISKLDSLEISEYVTILISSQPLQELANLNGFSNVDLPPWTESDVKSLMMRYELDDVTLSNEKKISSEIFRKSEGNPLYCTFLIKELLRSRDNPPNLIEHLPAYSSNLTNYYDYLLLKIPTLSLPYSLCGCSFRVTDNELKEITGLGNVVYGQLEILSPILKMDLSQGGFIIYHESFRRFIIDRLRNEEVDIKRVIYEPVINWLKSKDYFTFQKAYRFLFPLLIEVEDYQFISNYISDEFIIDSYYYGNSEQAVRSNYHYMTIAATKLESFPLVATINELNRTLKTTEHEFWEEYERYIEALGLVHGFDLVDNVLMFEGKITVSEYQGLQACYVSSVNGHTPRWDLYADSILDGEEIKIDDLKVHLRYLIDQNDLEGIEDIGAQIFKMELRDYGLTFLSELNSHSEAILDEIPIALKLKNLLNDKPEGDLFSLAESLTNIDHPSEKDVNTLDSFIRLLDWKIKNEDFQEAERLEEVFNGDFWFHNWVLFHLRLRIIEKENDLNRIVDCYKLLSKNTEPFKGNPNASRLYSLHAIIRQSIISGFKHVQSTEDWSEVVKILAFVSHETSTFLQGSQTGPLNTNALFGLIGDQCPKHFVEGVVEELSVVLSEVESYLFHATLAHDHFVLSKLYSLAENREKASDHLRRGLVFLLGYTHRKDSTIEELLNCVESFSKVYSGSMLDEFIELKEMVESVSNHTDGKGTRHFNNVWFKEFNKVMPLESLLYLSNNLYKVEYNWILENNLEYLLLNLNGKYPDIEFMISSTLVTNNTEEFLFYRLDLFDKISHELSDFALSELAHIFEIITSKSDVKHSDELRIKFNSLSRFIGLNCEINLSQKEKSDYSDRISLIQVIDNRYTYRSCLSELTDEEVLDYISKNGIKKTEVESFCHYFKDKDTVTEIGVEQVRAIVRSKQKKNHFVDELFSEDSCYYSIYWIERFVSDRGGWFENHINSDAFEKAYRVDPNGTLNYVFESLFDKVNGEYPERLLSGNLINTLVKAKYNSEVVSDMWSNLKSAIKLRLPCLIKEDWEENLRNDLNLSERDLLVKILLSRLHNGSIERIIRVCKSVSILLTLNPDSLIKPLAYFFENHDQSLKSIKQIVLQMLLEINSDISGVELLQSRLIEMYPQEHFSIDFLLLNLVPGLDLPDFVVMESYNGEEITDDHLDAIISFNYKYQALKRVGYDLRESVSMQSNRLKTDRKNDMEIFYNRSEELMIPNIYPTDYMRSSINTTIYAETVVSPRIPVPHLFQILAFDLDFLVSCYSSLIPRPNYKIPNESTIGFSQLNLESEDNWITLGTYERCSLKNGFREERKTYRTFRGISFGNPNDNYPHSGFEIHPYHVYNNIGPEHKTSEIIFSFLQEYDCLEQFDFIWPNPSLLRSLEITPPLPYKPLIGYNKKGEDVLRFEQWKSSYLIHYGGEIKEEVPIIIGCRVRMRSDYFKKLEILFGEKAGYYELNMHPNVD